MSTYPAGVKYITGDMPEGVSIGKDADDLAGMHGRAVAQISNITIVSASITSNGITAGFDALVTAVNASIGAMTQKGLVAAS